MMWWWGGDHMGAAGWIGLVFMIIIWVAFIAAIVLLIRYLVGRSDSGWGHGPGPHEGGYGGPYGGGYSPQHHPSDALRILEERYARGEIDREEFIRRRDDLLGRSDTKGTP